MERNYLTKQQTHMTKGLAILCMLILHLFCRKGTDVFGQPLLWLNSDTPVVYILGFLAEICVPLYSMCSGYAHFVIGENQNLAFRKNIRRIFKFLLNYWIVVIMFSGIGLVFHTPDIPVSFLKFIRTLFLLDSYNGAWWYVATYVLLCLCSGAIYKIMNKINSFLIFLLASVQYMIFYFIDAVGLLSATGNGILSFSVKQIDNFFGDVLLCYILGMLLAKMNIFTVIHNIVTEIHISATGGKVMKAVVVVIISAIVFFLQKAIVMPYYALIIFCAFNNAPLKGITEKVFTFLGTHSTNIWLIHMFFYLCMFPGLVFIVKYPVFMLLYLLAICVVFSYMINFIYKHLLFICQKK